MKKSRATPGRHHPWSEEEKSSSFGQHLELELGVWVHGGVGLEEAAVDREQEEQGRRLRLQASAAAGWRRAGCMTVGHTEK
jgi:hypothetical protein